VYTVNIMERAYKILGKGRKVYLKKEKTYKNRFRKKKKKKKKTPPFFCGKS